MNKVILMGRLTREPDSYEGNTKVARFSLAVDRRFKKEGEQNVDYITCVSFGKGADFAQKYLHKGTKILVTGHIQTGSYTAQDGSRRNTFDVIVEDYDFCESRVNTQGEGKPADDDDFMKIPDGIDSELPFA